MKKSAFLLNIVIFMYMKVNAQDNNHIQLIEQFLNSIENEEVTIRDLYKQGIIHLSEKNPEKSAALNDEYAQVIFLAIRDSLKACTEQNRKYEILDLEQSINKKHYDSNIQIPENGHIYLLYCDKAMITHLLIQDNKIIAFSTINKGRKRIFMFL